MVMDHVSLSMCCGLQGQDQGRSQGQAIGRGRRLKISRTVSREGNAISMEFLQKRASLHAKVRRD